MLANTITLSRALGIFVVIALFGRHRALDVALIFAIAVIFSLDAVDGYIARRRNETSDTGAFLDTIADRVVEMALWIYFTANGQIPLWMPIIVVSRCVLTDILQKLFGYPENGWTHALTRSRLSRGLYGGMKMLTFLCLAGAQVFNAAPLGTLSFVLAHLTVAGCLLRGLPFFFIRKTSCPQSP